MTTERLKLGQQGEQLVAEWYESRGWQVIDRNWKSGRGEIDLIVCKNQTLVFCEVKTRSKFANFAPSDAVDWRKQKQLRKLAAQWLADSPAFYPEVRFDVAEVIINQTSQTVNVLEQAF